MVSGVLPTLSATLLSFVDAVVVSGAVFGIRGGMDRPVEAVYRMVYEWVLRMPGKRGERVSEEYMP